MGQESCEGNEKVDELLPLRFLPPGFLKVREYCGDAVLWGLFKGFAGMRVAVPRQVPGNDHELCLVLGVDGARALVGAFGGEVINVPVCDAARRRLRDESIRARVWAGASVNAVAHEVGLTYRQVQVICKRDLREEQLNYDLFQ